MVSVKGVHYFMIPKYSNCNGNPFRLTSHVLLRDIIKNFVDFNKVIFRFYVTFLLYVKHPFKLSYI